MNVVAERSIKKLESYCVTGFKLIFNAERFLSLLQHCNNKDIIPMKFDLMCCSRIAEFSAKNQVVKIILPKEFLEISIKDLNMVDNIHIYD